MLRGGEYKYKIYKFSLKLTFFKTYTLLNMILKFVKLGFRHLKRVKWI